MWFLHIGSVRARAAPIRILHVRDPPGKDDASGNASFSWDQSGPGAHTPGFCIHSESINKKSYTQAFIFLSLSHLHKYVHWKCFLVSVTVLAVLSILIQLLSLHSNETLSKGILCPPEKNCDVGRYLICLTQTVSASCLALFFPKSYDCGCSSLFFCFSVQISG